MKKGTKKRGFKRIFAVIGCIALLFFTFTSCNQTKEKNKIHTTDVIRYSGIQEYGPYLYYNDSKIYRYNINTNTFSKACIDPTCDGTCALENVIGFVYQVYDGKLVFYSYQAYTHDGFYGYQDTVSGEVKILRKLQEREDSSAPAYVYNDKLYFKKNILRERGSMENPDDYIPHICRIPFEGGVEEVLFECGNESLVVVADGIIITYDTESVFAYDTDTLEKKTLFKLEDYGYTHMAGIPSYLNGNLYLRGHVADGVYSEYNENMARKLSYLVAVDVHTGELTRVVDEPVIQFCVTNEGIYYAPLKLRHMYIPEDYEENPNKIQIFWADETLHFCNHDGSGKKEVYTNEKMDYVEMFTVIDNILYGLLFDYDDESHRWGERYHGSIDLATGVVTKAIDMTE